MTGKLDLTSPRTRILMLLCSLVGPDMSVSAIDISALASQLTSNFLASLTNAAVVTNHTNSPGNLPIKYVPERSSLLRKFPLFSCSFSIINRECQATNMGSPQTIMLTNSPNSIILTGQQQHQQQQQQQQHHHQQQQQQQQQPALINRNLIKQESILYATSSAAPTGRNELCYEPSSGKSTRLWQWNISI